MKSRRSTVAISAQLAAVQNLYLPAADWLNGTLFMHSYASAAGTVGVAIGEVTDTSNASSRMLAQAFSGTVVVVIGAVSTYEGREGM